MKEPAFVHLALHTEYSLIDSVVRIPALMQRCAELGLPAAALTDQDNLFAMVKFYRQAMRAGVKPLIGADLTVAGDDDPATAGSLILLCKSVDGYRNLTRLISRSYLEGQQHGRPMLNRDWLSRESTTGLIGLAGGMRGSLARPLLGGDGDTARAELDAWRQVFGEDFVLDVARVGRSDEERHIDAVVNLAVAEDVAVVATNDVRFLAEDDFNAHEARVCIHQGRVLNDPKRPHDHTRQQYLRSPDEMAELFADLPEAVSNTLAIAEKLNLDIELGQSYLPEFPVPDGMTARSYLDKLARDSLAGRLDEPGAVLAAGRDDYGERLGRELGVIGDMGFPGYFLIVADFIRWAKEHGVPVGPGRGSGAGSLVAYVLGITDIDPLRYDLLFERFLNPERVSMPDFDIDFCMEGRDSVIDYVAERYGRERVSQIITYGTMAAKAVVRDAGRVLGQPYGFVDRIAKLIPFEIGMTLDKALDSEAELAELVESDGEVAAVMELARSLEGLVRNAGKHAGGVVIAPTELTDFAPLYCEPGGANTVTQFDKDDVEAAGLVKFDFLGLRTLTVIAWAVETINAARARAGEPALDIRTLPMDDERAFALLQSRRTTAVFQLESRGMKDLIKRLKPDSFEDLIALVALFRPGPLQSGMVDDFIERKHQPAGSEIDYMHPDLKSVLEPTYGVILYQEQVMQIAQILAGYTLGGADLLRRAMGKKKPEEMAKQREIFVGGAAERGVPQAQATHIFDLMEKFAGYGFNKSHSAAYALLSYQTAWLKARYPAEFMAAVMSADLDHTDKLVSLKRDCQEIGLTLLPPDVNSSAYEFTVAGDRRIRYALGAIKGVGRNVVMAVLAEREANGEFASLGGFCQRLGSERLNRRTVEALIKAGAFDALDDNRRALLESAADAQRCAEQSAQAAAAGQNDLFGLPQDSPAVEVSANRVSPWTEFERLRNEKEALGLYLSGHPFEAVSRDAGYFTTAPLGDLVATPEPAPSGGERRHGGRGQDVTVAGLVMDIRKRGNRVTFVLDDDTAQIEASLFAEGWDAAKHVLVKDAIVVVTGSLRYDDFLGGWRVQTRDVHPIDTMIEERARRVILSVRANGQGADLFYRLHDVMLPYRSGRCSVYLQYVGDQASARIRLGDDWSVRPTRELRESLESLLGSRAVVFDYVGKH